MMRVLLLLTLLSVVVRPAKAESLRDLIEKSLQNHPSVQSQAFRIESGVADVKTAGWQFYPTFGIDYTTGDRSNSLLDRSFSESFESMTDTNATTISLEQPLWTGGRLSGGLDKANASLLEVREGMGQVQRELALSVVQAYGEWLSANLKAEGWKESLAIHIGLRETVTRRVEEGVASEGDKLLANSRLESVAADLAAAQAQEVVALFSLEQLVGEGLNIESLEVDPALPTLERDLKMLIAQAQELSPGVRGALAQVEVAKAEVSIQKSSRFPGVFLRVEHEFGTRGSTAESFTDSRIVLGIRSTFGAGLSTFSDADSSYATYQSSLAAVDVQRRAVIQQVQGDYQLESSFGVRLSALGRAGEATEDVFNSYNRQYLAGRKSWFELLNSARDLVQSKIQLADAESAHLVVTWRLSILTQDLLGLIRNPPE